MDVQDIRCGYANLPNGTAFHFYGTDPEGPKVPRVEVYFTKKRRNVRVFIDGKEWKAPNEPA